MKEKRACVFAHWDAQNEIKPFIVYHLEKLRELCGAVVLVSTCELSDAEKAKVERHVDAVMVIANRGFDFMAWRRGIEMLDLQTVSELALVNSSVFGPVGSLADSFEKMAGADFWGMTESVEIARHVQSYFLVFGEKFVRSKEFRAFWDSVLPYTDKAQVVRSYEIGLSSYVRSLGLVTRSISPPMTVRRGPLMPPQLNPTIFHPTHVLAAGVPYVKSLLFRENPANVDLRRVRQRMAEKGYDTSLIAFDRPRTAAAICKDSA
jgi:lipopolysaccharide biosynthesis protein